MKITKIELYKMDLPLDYPLETALGLEAHLKNVLVKIYTDNGLYGLGEASPYNTITGGTQATNFALGKDLAQLILQKNPLEIRQRMAEINQYCANSQPSIRSAFDMAMFDLIGKHANMPVFSLLGGHNRILETDCTIGWQKTVQATVARAQELVSQGFTELKFKTGRPGDLDYQHLKAVRDTIGPKIDMKIDCNQGWDVAQTIRNVDWLTELNIKYLEQPIAVWDKNGFREIRSHTKIPLCADESVFDAHDAFQLCTTNAVDYLNIKLGKAGGILEGIKINAVAESYGAKCMIGCFYETRLGLTAAAHLVLAFPNITFLDLDSALFAGIDPIIGGMEYDKEQRKYLHIPQTAGLGVDIKEEYLNQWEKTALS